MEVTVTIEIWQKGDLWLAKAPELDFISQGRTLEEAKENLFEVVRIQFAEMRETGTLDEYLAECGFVTRGSQIVPLHEVVGFEKSTVVLA